MPTAREMDDDDYGDQETAVDVEPDDSIPAAIGDAQDDLS